MPVGMGGEQLADLAQFRGRQPPTLNDFVFPHRYWIYREEGSESRQKCKNLWAARSLELVPTPTFSRALRPLSQNENCCGRRDHRPQDGPGWNTGIDVPKPCIWKLWAGLEFHEIPRRSRLRHQQLPDAPFRNCPRPRSTQNPQAISLEIRASLDCTVIAQTLMNRAIHRTATEDFTEGMHTDRPPPSRPDTEGFNEESTEGVRAALTGPLLL